MLLWTNICSYNSSQKVNKRAYEHYQSKYMWRLVHEHLWPHFCRTEPMPTGFQYNVQKCTCADSKICITSSRIRRSLFLESSLDDILALKNWGTTLLLSVIRSNVICSDIIPHFLPPFSQDIAFSCLLGLFVKNKEHKSNWDKLYLTVQWKTHQSQGNNLCLFRGLSASFWLPMTYLK